MSDERKIDRSVIENMSIKTLKALLLDDLNDPDGILDDETRLCAAQTLARKEKEQGTKIPEAEASLEQFKREYLPYAKFGVSLYDDDTVKQPKRVGSKRRAVLKIAAVIAAVVILGAVSVGAMDFDLWDSLASWTKSTFGFSEQSEVSVTEYPEQLSKLENEMRSHGVDPHGLIPGYLPDGYEQVDTKCAQSEHNSSFVCVLSDGGKSIVMQYTVYLDGKSGGAYEKADASPEIYEVSGVKHYIMTNDGNCLAVWMSQENVECSLSVDGSRDELVKIINSIYGD